MQKQTNKKTKKQNKRRNNNLAVESAVQGQHNWIIWGSQPARGGSLACQNSRGVAEPSLLRRWLRMEGRQMLLIKTKEEWPYGIFVHLGCQHRPGESELWGQMLPKQSSRAHVGSWGLMVWDSCKFALSVFKCSVSRCSRCGLSGSWLTWIALLEGLRQNLGCVCELTTL